MAVTATIHHGQVPIRLSGPVISKGDRGVLDAVEYELLVETAGWEQDALDLGFVIGQKVAGFPAVFVQSLRMEPENEVVATVSVSCLGLTSLRDKRQRRMSVAGREVAIGPDEVVVLAWSTDEQGSEANGGDLEGDKVKRRVPKLDSNGDPIYKTITTPLGGHPRWNVREPIVVVTDTYYTMSRPDMSVAGKAFTPPNAPTPPPYVWGGYVEPMRANFPKDWVLDDRQVEEIFYISDSIGLYQVTDVMAFYYPLTPD